MTNPSTPNGKLAVLPLDLMNQILNFLATKHTYADVAGLMQATTTNIKVIDAPEPPKPELLLEDPVTPAE